MYMKGLIWLEWQIFLLWGKSSVLRRNRFMGSKGRRTGFSSLSISANICSYFGPFNDEAFVNPIGRPTWNLSFLCRSTSKSSKCSYLILNATTVLAFFCLESLHHSFNSSELKILTLSVRWSSFTSLGLPTWETIPCLFLWTYFLQVFAA